jgi:hypothetical protein
MKLGKMAWILGTVILLILTTGALAAEKAELINGTHWSKWPETAKLVYVRGVGNMADFEVASGGSSRAACISKGFVDELKTKTLGEITADVDKYYKENPAKMNTAVVEVILRRSTKLCPPEPPAPEKKK